MANQVTPEVGMGATWSPWTDCYPCTIVVVTPRTLVTRDDEYEVVGGSILDGSAKYEYSPNPEGSEKVWTLRKNGRWVRQGETMNGRSLTIGIRRAYRDPSY